jgi:capsular polysaccharide biosynthesis protein
MTTAAQNGAPAYEPEPQQSDPREFFWLLWRHKWVLIACLVLIPLATYLVSTRLPKTYEASTSLQLQAVGGGESLPGIGDLSGGSSDTQTSDRVAALIETNGVADQAARVLHEPIGSLRGSVHASADENTGFITITASAGTAKRAAKIANAFAEAVRVTRAKQGLQQVNDAIASTQGQLNKQSKANQDPSLTQQLQGLLAVRSALGQNAQVIQPATPPDSPASPEPLKNALFALIVAIIVATVLIALIDRLDRRFHDPDELEKLTGAPLLVHIPPSAFPGSQPDPGVPLAFQMLRDSLVYFNVDEPLDSLIVVSSLKGEGKTTVAANLAVAYARTGKRPEQRDRRRRSTRGGASGGSAVRRAPARPAGRHVAPEPVRARRVGAHARDLRGAHRPVGSGHRGHAAPPGCQRCIRAVGRRVGSDRHRSLGSDPEGCRQADGGRGCDRAHAAAGRGGHGRHAGVRLWLWVRVRVQHYAEVRPTSRGDRCERQRASRRGGASPGSTGAGAVRGGSARGRLRLRRARSLCRAGIAAGSRLIP